MTNPAPANVVAVYLTPIGHEFTPERLAASVHGPAAGMECWPWDLEWFKPGNPLHVPEDRLRCLDKAGALLLAERERLDRAGKAPQ